MLEIIIPGFRNLYLNHLIMDYNGTLACDGCLIQGVRDRLDQLASQLSLHIITADTFGKVKAELEGLPCKLTVLPQENQDRGKLHYLNQLGAEKSVCIGNGRNDRLMLKAASLGMAIIQGEGAAVETITSADVVVPDIITGLDLLCNPLRLVATLRS